MRSSESKTCLGSRAGVIYSICILEEVKACSEELKSYLPAWKDYITATVFNAELANTYVLGNVNKSKIKPLHDKVKQLIAHVCLAYVRYYPGEEDMPQHKTARSILDYAGGAVAFASDAIVITSSLNAVLLFANKPAGPKMARDVVALAAAVPFEIPAALSCILVALGEGNSSLCPVMPTQSKKARVKKEVKAATSMITDDGQTEPSSASMKAEDTQERQPDSQQLHEAQLLQLPDSQQQPAGAEHPRIEVEDDF